jgi:hypothetical protein
MAEELRRFGEPRVSSHEAASLLRKSIEDGPLAVWAVSTEGWCCRGVVEVVASALERERPVPLYVCEHVDFAFGFKSRKLCNSGEESEDSEPEMFVDVSGVTDIEDEYKDNAVTTHHSQSCGALANGSTNRIVVSRWSRSDFLALLELSLHGCGLPLLPSNSLSATNITTTPACDIRSAVETTIHLGRSDFTPWPSSFKTLLRGLKDEAQPTEGTGLPTLSSAPTSLECFEVPSLLALCGRLMVCTLRFCWESACETVCVNSSGSRARNIRATWNGPFRQETCPQVFVWWVWTMVWMLCSMNRCAPIASCFFVDHLDSFPSLIFFFCSLFRCGGGVRFDSSRITPHDPCACSGVPSRSSFVRDAEFSAQWPYRVLQRTSQPPKDPLHLSHLLSPSFFCFPALWN